MLDKIGYISVGDRFEMLSGLWITVIERITGKKIKVSFDVSGYTLIVEGAQIRRGSIRDWIADGYNPGDKFVTKNCGKITILSYKSATRIAIQFDDTGWITTVSAIQIKRTNIQDRLQPTVYGVGYLGDGTHKAALKSGKGTWTYARWNSMLERCYCPSFQSKHPYYNESLPDVSWLNFQVFAEWASKQVGYEVDRWQLEKDILVRGNKLYTPSTCCFVPQELNTLIIKADAARGILPIGLTLHTDQKYSVHVSGISPSGYVGVYDDIDFAFSRYKEVKEARIKQQAAKWQSQIDPRAYEALMNYEVLITD